MIAGGLMVAGWVKTGLVLCVAATLFSWVFLFLGGGRLSSSHARALGIYRHD
jgi:hypothetical protein